MAIFGVGETIDDTVPIAPGAYLCFAFLDASMTKLIFNKLLAQILDKSFERSRNTVAPPQRDEIGVRGSARKVAIYAAVDAHAAHGCARDTDD
jgi:hypothetical protein